MFILNWIGKLFIQYVVVHLVNFIKWISLNEQKKAIDRENLKKYQDAVKSGDENEIAKAGEDLLNGISRRH